MLKKYRKTLIITTLVLLVPMVVGLLLWNKLPEQVPVHFNAAGEADDYGSRAFAVFGLPGFLLALHWLCVLASMKGDPKAANLEGKPMTLVMWICPVIGLVVMLLLYASALGYQVPVEVIAPALVGVMLIVIGNWLPKCKQTYTLGIKLPWTLDDEDNWNRTHRFAGPIWIAAGAVTVAAAFLGGWWLWVMIPALAAAVIAPMVYSYCLFRKKTRG